MPPPISAAGHAASIDRPRSAPFFWSALIAAAPCVLGHRVVRWPGPLVELLVLGLVYGAIYAGVLWWKERARVMRIVRLART